jgi:hypothetical protein
VEQRGLEPLASALRTAIRVLWTTKKHLSFVISPNKNAAANKTSSLTNYDPERPILTKFGNVLATEICDEKTCSQNVAQFLITRAGALLELNPGGLGCLVTLQYGLSRNAVAINLRERLPIEASRILNERYPRVGCAVEHDVEPVVFAPYAEPSCIRWRLVRSHQPLLGLSPQ